MLNGSYPRSTVQHYMLESEWKPGDSLFTLRLYARADRGCSCRCCFRPGCLKRGYSGAVGLPGPFLFRVKRPSVVLPVHIIVIRKGMVMANYSWPVDHRNRVGREVL